MIPGLMSNLDLMWELTEMIRALRHSGRVLGMVMLDKRGSGLSDRGSAAPDVETHAADVIGIMDQEGIERASLFEVSEGRVVALATAALLPDRVINVDTSGTPLLAASDEQLPRSRTRPILARRLLS
jgi:pimeloyl-ACP methyl ester carboxylesterase